MSLWLCSGPLLLCPDGVSSLWTGSSAEPSGVCGIGGAKSDLIEFECDIWRHSLTHVEW